jgi:hypothetical protein
VGHCNSSLMDTFTSLVGWGCVVGVICSRQACCSGDASAVVEVSGLNMAQCARVHSRKQSQCMPSYNLGAQPGTILLGMSQGDLSTSNVPSCVAVCVWRTDINRGRNFQPSPLCVKMGPQIFL